MRNLPASISAAFTLDDPSPCNCKNIRARHLKSALGHGPFESHHDLYAAALEIRLADASARPTGREHENGKRFCCGTCLPYFKAAVAVQSAQAAPQKVIMLTAAAATASDEPCFPKDSCYTCPEAIAGNCIPRQPLACGS